MIEIFKISLAVFALWYCFLEGEIFGFVQRLQLGNLSNPLRDCPVCMVPWWGSLIYWIWFAGPLEDYITTIICALGLNAVIVHLFPKRD